MILKKCAKNAHFSLSRQVPFLDRLPYSGEYCLFRAKRQVHPIDESFNVFASDGNAFADPGY